MTKPESKTSLCLSIVVPIYNVSQYLGRCVDSLLNSDGIEKTEIILVDDGSTDNSGVIADSYAEKYDYITCLHKINGGLSDARNYGLQHAKGKYVFFCDSDDMVIPEGLAKVIKTAGQCSAEIILWDGITIDDRDVVTDASHSYVLAHTGLDSEVEISGIESMIRQIKEHGRFAVTAWLRACSRSFLLENHLFFEKGLVHEDELWTPKAMISASHVLYLKENVYCYRIRDNSIMGSYSEVLEKHAQAFVYIMNTLNEYYSEQVIDSQKQKIITAYWAETYLWEITRYCIYRFECRRYVPRFRLLSSVKGFKNKAKAVFLCLFGFRAYGAIINSLKR